MESLIMDEWKERLKDRVRKRLDRMHVLAERFITAIDDGSVDSNFDAERERMWLERFAQEGEGLNLCCGNFALGNSYGLNINRSLASDFILPVDMLDRFGSNSFDYIISNHLESVNSPMHIFHAIYRILKPGGLLALVFINADAEVNSNDDDVVLNSIKKVSFFSRTIMRRYLIKAGFDSIEITDAESPIFLRAIARRDA